MTRLRQEFAQLQKRYNLKTLNYFAFKPRTVPRFFQNNTTAGLYLRDYNCIIMRNGHCSKHSIKTMLHEMCHAIQCKEGRFVPDHHHRRNYALELEAEMFAHTEYKKYYANVFGAIEYWNLAEYSFYKSVRTGRLSCDAEADTMSANEITNFIKSLKNKDKKNIINIAKNNSNQCWYSFWGHIDEMCI